MLQCFNLRVWLHKPVVRFNCWEPLKGTFFFFALCSSLTELLKGRDPELVVVVLGQRRRALAHDLGRDGLGGNLHGVHAADERLEPLVGERGLAAVQLDDPAEGRRREQRRVKIQLFVLLAVDGSSRFEPVGVGLTCPDRRACARCGPSPPLRPPTPAS